MDTERIIRFLESEYLGWKLDSSYKVCKVGLVFHTWVAIKGTGIFPEYTRRLLFEATIFQKEKISVMIIYSRLNLPRIEEKKMVQDFGGHPNIILLCLEDTGIPRTTYLPYYTADLSLMDHLRLAVIKHSDIVLEEIRFRAESTGKTELLDNIQTVGDSIMYADMDILFPVHPVPDILCKDGACSFPVLHPVFGGLKHEEFGTDWIDNVLSGRVHDFLRKTNLNIPALAYGENCLILVRYDSIPKFLTKITMGDLIVNLHSPPNKYYPTRSDDPWHKPNHGLVFLQMHETILHRHDRTWQED